MCAPYIMSGPPAPPPYPPPWGPARRRRYTGPLVPPKPLPWAATIATAAILATLFLISRLGG